MRILGGVLILFALGIGVLWPWAQITLGGNELAKLEYSNIRASAETLSLNLTQDHNPVRIRFQAKYLVDGKLPPTKIPVRVLITDREGALLTGKISFATQGIATGPEQGKVRGSQPIEFNVLNDGEHNLLLELAINSHNGGIIRPDIDTVTATVIANAPAINDDYKALSAVLALVGFYLFVRAKRRKRTKGGSTPPQQHWGRGDN